MKPWPPTCRLLACLPFLAILIAAVSPAAVAHAEPDNRIYPWHTGIVSTTFWVGEIIDPSASDGSQVFSTYDKDWMANYGGCDGVIEGGVCRADPRESGNGFFPTAMVPRQNPFYLDLPFDDLNNPEAFAIRGKVIPWAQDSGYKGNAGDRGFSYMKNRWVELRKNGRTCFGQIQDAGPAVYNDAAYVFGSDDRRPVNTRFNGAGLDVSPALNACLGYKTIDGAEDRVDWRFVEPDQVPAGPWTRIITTQPVVPW